MGRRASNSRTRALSLLENPRTALDLQDRLKISRQRVYQLLHSLASHGLVRRVVTRSRMPRYVYVKTNRSAGNAIRTYVPHLRRTESEVLSALAPNTRSFPRDIGRVIGRSVETVRHAGTRLAALGLVRSSRWSRLLLLSITPKGLRHSQYRRQVKKVASFNAAERVSGNTLNVVMVLSRIGAARSLHVTRLIRNLGREGPNTTKVIHSLRKSGYVERVGSGGEVPMYRLTAAGRQWSKPLLADVESPSRVELRRRLHADSRRKTTAGSRRKKKPLRATVAKEIICLLRDRGKLPKRAINSILSEPYSNIRGLESILYRMAARGLIVRVKREYVLAAPAALGGSQETTSKLESTEAS